MKAKGMLVKIALVLAIVFSSVLNSNAQIDSIYGLQAQIVQDTLKATFYSTYNIESFKVLQIHFINPTTNQYYVTYTAVEGSGTVLNSTNEGDYTFALQPDGSYKFSVKVKLDAATISRNLKISFYTWGSNYKSQYLTYFFTKP